MARTTAAKAVTVKIPPHKTPVGRWCLFSGCDSTTGICRMCEPETDAEIIAALPLRARPALYLDHANSVSNTGKLLVLEAPEDPDEGDGIIGLAMDAADGWYLGCIECGTEVEEADSGMCLPCRQDAAWNDQEQLYAQEQPEV